MVNGLIVNGKRYVAKISIPGVLLALVFGLIYVLGQVTTLKAERANDERRLERIEDKVDRILERLSENP